MMNYEWLYKKAKIFLLLSLFLVASIWIFDFAFSSYKQYRFNQDQLVKRDVMLDIAMKASSIISSNNPSPLFYKTLNRIVIRSPNEAISGYIYSENMLRIRLASQVNLFEISRLFEYLPYEKKDNDYEIRI